MMEMKKYKLGDIASIIVGYPFESERFNTNGKGVRLVRGMNVSERFLRFGEEARWWDDLSDKLRPYYLQEDDILIGMDGSKVGKNFAIVKKDDLPLLLVQRVACVRAKKGFDQHFIWQYVSSPRFMEYVNTIKTGSSIPHISGGQIASFPIFAPSYDVQKKIGALFSFLDSKISLNQAINRNLEALAKQLYDYWFVQFDFPDENGKPYKSSGGKMVWNEVLKKEIPEGWEVRPLFESVSVQYGFPFSTESFTEEVTNIPVVRIRDILDGTISAYSYEDTDEKYHLHEGDVLVGMDGNFHMNYWHNNNAYLNQRCVRIRPYSNSPISSIQVLHAIKPFIKAKEQNAKGSTVGHLSDKDIKGLFLIEPEISEIFNPRIDFDSLLKLMIKNKQEITSLTRQRDELLPLLMNGQVSVNSDL